MLLVHDQLRAQARARGAGSVRRVERERAGLELLDRRAVERTGVALREDPLLEHRGLALARDGRNPHDALAKAQRRLDRVRQPGGVRVRDGRPGRGVDGPALLVARPALGSLRAPHDEPVDHDLDRVALVLVEGGRLGQVVLDPVDADTDEALLARSVEDAVALGLAVLDERAEDEQARPLGLGQHLVHDLAHRLPLDLAPAVRAVRVSDAREQEAQVVVDLGHGPDRRPRVAAGALLVDGDRRRQAVDLVDVRLLHLAQELARVRAEALDVPPLALGVDGVEREAGLAAPGQAGDHDQPVTRERDADVLEVVLARAAHDNAILGHVQSVPGSRQREHLFTAARVIGPIGPSQRGPFLPSRP
jgi:hypothetical protein